MATPVLALPFYDESALLDEWYVSFIMPSVSNINIDSLARDLKALQTVPELIIGGNNTDIKYWYAAKLAFPEAEYLVGVNGKLSTLPFTLPVVAFDAITEAESEKLIDDAFKYACWGDSAEHRRKLADIEDEAKKHLLVHPALLREVQSAIKNGKESADLKQVLETMLRQGVSRKEVNSWIESQSCGNFRIKRDLSIALKKYLKSQEQRQKRYAEKYNPSLEQVVVDDLHPNSLRALKPSKSWQVVIDETGSHFNPEDMDGVGAEDTKVGKLVALVIPEEVSLALLSKNFHAVNETDQDVESAISTLLNNPVGIFGYSMSDSYYSIHSWMAAIVQLTKWVMYLLPIEEESNCEVEFLIEGRGQFGSETNLQPLQEDIESTLKDLAPNRYKNLKLKLKIIGKEGHLANGYVDAVANLWGSSAKNRRKILNSSALLGNCLINTSERSLEQLLLALQSSEPLHDRLWFELCEFAGNENEYSLANQFLAELGQKLNTNVAVWNSYVISIKQRLQDKEFTTAGLAAALTWLQNYSPDESSLDDALLLQLKSSQLALRNHQGFVDLSLISECMTLAASLKDEMAVDCCSVVLRIASSTTNAFDFDGIVSWLQQWIDEPIAVPGLLNHGKLHSALGQLYAFQGDFELALTSFERALESFSKLSNAKFRLQNKMQTQMYLITVLMDQGDVQAVALITELLGRELNMVKGHAGRIAKLASSGDQYRFLHHLFLRACICFPVEMKDDIKKYLLNKKNWLVGESHPWMLIQAYRGWLLHKEGDTDSAVTRFESAITECLSETQGPIVNWMGATLYELAKSLDLNLNINSDLFSHALNSAPENAPKTVLDKWKKVTSDENRIELLKVSLPFNFH